MQVFPAVDLSGGRCVRLWQGDFAQETVFDANPIAMAELWHEHGADWLHLVDLDGARSGHPVHLQLLRQLTKRLPLKVQFGGGLRSTESVQLALAAGATRVIVGTRAIREPDWLADLLVAYPDQIVVSLDTKDGQLAVAGWQEAATQQPLEVAARLKSLGVSEIIHTAVERDGTMSGPDLQTLSSLLQTGLAVIAAGGISSLADLRQLLTLESSGLSGTVIGRALYEHRIDLGAALRLVKGETTDVG